MSTDQQPSVLAILPPTPTLAQLGAAANTSADQQPFADYQRRLDPATLTRHRYDLAIWCLYLEDAGLPMRVDELLSRPECWAGTTHGLLAGFVQWMLLDGFSIGTINIRLSTVRAYAKRAAAAGAISALELALIDQVKGYSQGKGHNVDAQRPVSRKGAKKAQPVLISVKQRAQLKQQPDTPRGRRDHLLMCLLLDHGLRCGEVADLVPSNVALDEGLLTFHREKVKKVQKHQLTSDTRLALQRYLEVVTPTTFLLMGSRKGHEGQHLEGSMSRRAITKRVRVLGERIGLAGLSAHDCRHAWVEAAIRGKTDLKALQEAGGWNSPAMPLRYAAAAEIANEGVVLA
jgi:integrase